MVLVPNIVDGTGFGGQVSDWVVDIIDVELLTLIMNELATQ